MQSRMLATCLVAALVAATSPSASASPDEDSTGRGYLGVRMQRIQGGLAEALDMKENSGVLLGQVMEESPAAEAGLEKGDILVAVDGNAVETPADLKSFIGDRNAGDEVTIEYLRDGRTQTARVQLGERPNRRDWSRKFAKVHELRVGRDHGFLGVVTQPLSVELGEFFGVENGEGALVSEVVDESPAQALGLEAGDVIVEVDGEKVRDPADLRSIVSEFEEEIDVEIVWVRDQREERGTATLEVRQGRHPQVFGWHGSGPHGFDLEPLRRHVDEGLLYFKSDEFKEEMDSAIDELRVEIDKLREELDEVRQQNAD